MFHLYVSSFRGFSEKNLFLRPRAFFIVNEPYIFYKPSQQLQGKNSKIISKEQRNYFKKQVGLLISKIFISKKCLPNLYGNFSQLSTIQSKQKSMNFRNSFQSLREKPTKKFEVKVFYNFLTNFLYHSSEFRLSGHL